MMLGKIFGSEFLEKIFPSILLQGLTGVSSRLPTQFPRREKWKFYLHVMKDGGPERHEIALVWIEDIHGAPAVAPDEFAANEVRRRVVRRRGVLVDEFVAGEGHPSNTIAV